VLQNAAVLCTPDADSRLYEDARTMPCFMRTFASMRMPCFTTEMRVAACRMRVLYVLSPRVAVSAMLLMIHEVCGRAVRVVAVWQSAAPRCRKAARAGAAGVRVYKV